MTESRSNLTSAPAPATSHRPRDSILGRRALFPSLSPVVEAVLFLDFAEPSPASLRAPWSDADIARLAQQRLASLALRLVMRYEVPLPPRNMDALRAAAFKASSTTLHHTARSARALAVLSEDHIPFVISKGPGIALTCRGVNERPFTDLDVLVTPNNFSRALARLAALDYSEHIQNRPPWPWFDRYCREAVNLRSAEGGSIDLHHHLPPWLWTRNLDVQTLIAAGEVQHFAGSDLPLLPPEHNLLVTAFHVVSDHDRPGQTLMAWRDLLTLARACQPQEALLLANRANLVGWLRWVIGELPDQVRPTELWQALSVSGQQPANRLRLWQLLPPAFGSRHALGHALRLPAPNSWYYVLGMLVPSRQFLHTKLPESHSPYLTWWRDCYLRVLAAYRHNRFWRLRVSHRDNS